MKSKVYAIQAFSKNPFPFNIFALAIRYFQKTNYSHYALMVMGEDCKFYDSTMWGVRERTGENFNKAYEITEGVLINEISEEEFILWFNSHRGKSYGFIQILGLLAKIFNIVRFNPFGKGAKRIICNELVILYTNYIGLTDIKDTDSLDLNDTANILKEVLSEKKDEK